MDILFIGSFLSKTRGTKGVSETLAENLSHDGISIKLVSRSENKFFRIVEIVIAILAHKGKKIHIDVFSGNSFFIAQLSTKIAKILNKQVILTLHGGRLIEFAAQNKKRVRLVFNRAIRIQTPSHFLKNYFIDEGFKINYLPNSVSLDKFPYNRTNVKPFSLLWVRGFASIYNPIIPVKILVEMLKLYPETTLTMVGPDKGLLEEVKLFALQNNVLDKVNFTGGIPNDSLYPFYQLHAVYLNTTSYESFGVAIVEAASCGIPIVSNRVGEIPYIWEENKNILFVEDNNIEKYVQHISNLCLDAEFAHLISLNARTNAEKFDWSQIKQSWIKLLID